MVRKVHTHTHSHTQSFTCTLARTRGKSVQFTKRSCINRIRAAVCVCKVRRCQIKCAPELGRHSCMQLACMASIEFLKSASPAVVSHHLRATAANRKRLNIYTHFIMHAQSLLHLAGKWRLGLRAFYLFSMYSRLCFACASTRAARRVVGA